MSSRSSAYRRAASFWQQARWQAAEAALREIPETELRGEALLLQVRLLTLRDPAAAVARARTLTAGRFSARFDAEASIVLGNGLSQIGEYAEAEERFARAQALCGDDADLLAKVALYRSVALMLQNRVERIEPLVPAIKRAASADIRAQGATMHAVLLRHREQYRAQIPVLLEALLELRAMPAPNAWVLCSVLHMLAEIVVEFWEPTLAAMVEERFAAIEWHGEIAVWHFFISRALSWWYALSGDSLAAFRYLKRAVELPVRDALLALNHADRAFLARGLGERIWSEQELTHADDLCRRATWETERDARDDASIALASLAELYARSDPTKASEYLARFAMFHQQLSSANTRRHDRIDRAFACATMGTVHAAQGKLSEAVRSLEESYAIYDEIGFDWRAGKVAVELAAVSGNRRYLDEARRKLARYQRSWLATAYREAAQHLGIADILPGVRLTPAQWQVLHLLADGFSLSEVAAHLGRSLNTIRNHAGAIYSALGVHSQKELRARVKPAPERSAVVRSVL
ncbi:MAG TPA: LuxR C-terminal-related transcriptional regulator [Candidatus Tumulicola sp.]|nr:LuxR C-terminal-related transcriptional regulator [Candidatus Tumulicola sp.]